MKLSEAQQLFTMYLGMLITWAFLHGYKLSLREAGRSKEQAAAYAASGVGIANSVHIQFLAADFVLFIGGVYQSDSAAYEPLGQFWKGLHPKLRWGGDFKDAKGKPKPDGGHFSFEWEGVK